MQIISVELKDLRSYQQAFVQFVPGVNALVGQNGAGKSTVLAAIGMALFNTRPPNNRTDDLIREGAKTAEIVVEFISTADERRYQVARRFGGSNYYRVHDPELGHQVLADGVADCESWLRVHLGVGPEISLSDLFENTVGVFQGTFTAPFLMPPGARKPIFDPLLRVDEYPKAVQALLGPRRTLAEQDQTAQVRIAQIEGQLQALPALRRQTAEVQARLEANEKALAHARLALQEAEQRCQAYDGQRAAVSVAEREQARLAAEVNTQQVKLKGAQDALYRATQAAERCQASLPGYQQYAQADSDRTALNALRTKRDAVKASIARLERRQDVGQTREQGIRDQLSALDDQALRAEKLEPLAARQDELDAALRAAQQAAMALKAARQQVADRDAALARQVALVERLAAQLLTREQLQLRLDELQVALDDNQQVAAQRQMLQGQSQARDEQLGKQLVELSAAAGGKCPVCEQPLTPEHRAELEQSVRAELAALREQIDALAREEKTAAQERAALQREQQDATRKLANLAGQAQLQEARSTQELLIADLVQARDQVAVLGDPGVEAARLTEALLALGDPRQELAICRHALDARPGLVTDLEATLRDLQVIGDELAAQQEALAPYVSLDERLALMERELARHSEAYQNYLSNQNEAAQAGERQQQVAALSAALEGLVARLAEADAALHSARETYDAEADKQAQAERLRHSQETAALDATLKADRDLLAQLVRQVADLETLQERLQALQGERERIAAAIGLIDWARQLLRDAGPLVTRQLVRRISLEAAGIFSELMDNHAVRLQWSEAYDLTLEVGGVERGYAQLSGGEQMCAALALRLALLRNLTGIDLAFFDEPTAHLDGERRSLLAQTLTQVRGFGQIFVISHDSTFEQAADAYFVVSKDAGGSHIERL